MFHTVSAPMQCENNHYVDTRSCNFMEVGLRLRCLKIAGLAVQQDGQALKKKEAKLYPNTCVKNGNYTRKYVINSGNLKAVRRVKTWELCRIKI